MVICRTACLMPHLIVGPLAATSASTRRNEGPTPSRARQGAQQPRTGPRTPPARQPDGARPTRRGACRDGRLSASRPRGSSAVGRSRIAIAGCDAAVAPLVESRRHARALPRSWSSRFGFGPWSNIPNGRGSTSRRCGWCCRVARSRRHRLADAGYRWAFTALTASPGARAQRPPQTRR